MNDRPPSKKEIIETMQIAVGLNYKRPYRRDGRMFYDPYRKYFAASKPRDKALWLHIERMGYADLNCINREGNMLFYVNEYGLKWLGKQLNITITNGKERFHGRDKKDATAEADPRNAGSSSRRRYGKVFE